MDGIESGSSRYQKTKVASILTRRGFVKWTAGLGGSLLLMACGGDDDDDDTDSQSSDDGADPTATEESSAPDDTPEPESEPATDTPQASGGDDGFIQFRFAERGGPPTFDPAEGVNAPAYRLFVNTYEGLVAYETGTTTLKPALAEDWEISDDLMTYIFNVRQGVEFHDGTPLNAQIVKDSFERVLELGFTPSIYLASVDTVSVLDDSTVELTLSQPSATFIEGLSRVYIHTLAADANPGADENWFATNINGTGPYKLAEFRQDEHMILDRHEAYWQGWPEGTAHQYIQRWAPEPATQKLWLEGGEVDMAGYYSSIPDEPASAYEEKGLQVFTSPTFRTFIVNMNTLGGYTADVNIRKAMASAFPYEEYHFVYLENAEIPSGFLPPGYPGHDPDRPKYRQDLDLAREYLAEAGYPDGGITLTMYYNQNEPQGERMSLVFSEILQEINITLDLHPVAPGSDDYVVAVRNAETEDAVEFLGHFLLSPLTADTGDYLHTVFGSERAGMPFNRSLYQNPEFDALIEQARQELDPEKREALWRQAEDLVVRDQPVIFTAWPTPIDELGSQSIESYTYHPLSYTANIVVYDMRFVRSG